MEGLAAFVSIMVKGNSSNEISLSKLKRSKIV